MILHPSEQPFLAISADYYPLSSTPSTLTQTALPGALFALPLPATIIQNHQLALRRLTHPARLNQVDRNRTSQEVINHSFSHYLNPGTPSTNTMPRPSIPKPGQDSEVFSAHPVSMIAGVKRDASAVSGPTLPPHLTAVHSSGQLGADDEPLRLPPKLKEAERMMHVQRWVNHLPGPGTESGTSDGVPIYWGFSNSPGFRNIDEDRELTPPPSRNYLSRLPFTPEEEQTMMRFFSHNSEYRHQHTPGAAVHNSYPVNNQLNYQPYQNPRSGAIRQAPTTNQHFTLPTQQTTQGPHGVEADSAPQCPPKAHRRLDQDVASGSRFFAEWEIRLISHLFHEYFPGRPEPMGNAGVLPSVGEVRSRIASSRLKDTRSAVAVRAKIKRMQSSGTWIEYH